MIQQMIDNAIGALFGKSFPPPSPPSAKRDPIDNVYIGAEMNEYLPEGIEVVYYGIPLTQLRVNGEVVASQGVSYYGRPDRKFPWCGDVTDKQRAAIAPHIILAHERCEEDRANEKRCRVAARSKAINEAVEALEDPEDDPKRR